MYITLQGHNIFQAVDIAAIQVGGRRGVSEASHDSPHGFIPDGLGIVHTTYLVGIRLDTNVYRLAEYVGALCMSDILERQFTAQILPFEF